MNLGTSYSFPSRLASNTEKASKEYALQVFRAVWSSFMQGTNSYYEIRNRQILNNRLFAKGDQPIQPLLDLMGIEGKQAYINIDMHPSPIAPKFKNVFVDGYMNDSERIKCDSVNKDVLTKKEKRKRAAEFNFDNKDFVDELQSATGITFRDKSLPEFTSREDLDIYYELNNREREEILMERLSTFVFDNNKWSSKVKRRVISDFWDAGFAAVWNYVDSNGKVHVCNVRPEAMIYGTSFEDDFSDSDYMGHVLRMNISEFREMFPYVDEKEIYQIAKSCSGMYGNTTFDMVWLQNWYDDYSRPYDDIKIELMYIWYKCDKKISFVDGKDSYGRQIFDIQNESGGTTNPRKKYGEKFVKTAYTGFWVINTDKVYEWSEERNQIRPHSELENILSPYSICMPDNDGTMLPKAPQETIKSYIRHMDECIFKIRQIIAKAAPDGYAIDIEALQNIDLGDGKGELQPITLESIYNQTGRLYYRSKDSEGESMAIPITPMVTGFGSKLQELIGTYNFNLQQIEGILGINQYRAGGEVNPKLGLGVLQEQMKNSNNATAKYYLGYIDIFSSTATSVTQRLWDGLAYNDNLSQEYKDIIGRDNAEFLKNSKEITASNYDIKISVGLSSTDRMMLEANIEKALQANMIELVDAMYIRDIGDTMGIKTAIRYLESRRQKKQKEAVEAQQQSQELQANLNDRNAKAAADAEAQLTKLKQAGEIEKEQISGSFKVREEEIKLISDMIRAQAQNPGMQLPPYVKKLIMKYETMLDAEVEAEDMEQEEVLQ